MKKFFVVIIAVFVIFCSSIFIYYNNGIKRVSNDKTDIAFNVKKGSNFYSIASQLKDAGLIKSELCYKIYIKLHKISSIESGVFVLNKSMDVKEITDKLQGKSDNPDIISITFKEGYDMNDIIKVIVDKTNNTEEDIKNVLNNQEYLNSLINKYWFINEDVLNQNLYYSLEGYLYPNTYQFDNRDVKVDKIFNTMVEQMDKQLSKYKSEIEAHNYTPHQILTLSSIVELEGLNSDDRSGIAGVFYNRIKANMNLGSDVTAYYGAQVEMSERDLYASELNSNNPYNTRSSSMAGQLPIGPICNPSIDSINAVLHPEQSNYYYFVSDKNGKTYFTSNGNEHQNKIRELKEAGLWYNY